MDKFLCLFKIEDPNKYLKGMPPKEGLNFILLLEVLALVVFSVQESLCLLPLALFPLAPIYANVVKHPKLACIIRANYYLSNIGLIVILGVGLVGMPHFLNNGCMHEGAWAIFLSPWPLALSFLSFAYYKELTNGQAVIEESARDAAIYEYIPETNFLFFFKVQKIRMCKGHWKKYSFILATIAIVALTVATFSGYFWWRSVTRSIGIVTIFSAAALFVHNWYLNADVLKVNYFANIILGIAYALGIIIENSWVVHAFACVAFYGLFSWAQYCWYIEVTQLPVSQVIESSHNVENINEVTKTADGKSEFPTKEALLANK